MLLRTAFTVLILVALGLIGWRVFAPDGVPARHANLTAAPAASDYYMRDATIYQMNRQGQLAYRIRLKKTLHYPDDSARLRHIRVHYNTGARSYWTLEAPRGRVPPGSHDLHLTGGVTLRHPKSEQGTIVIKTDNAWFRSGRNIIETEAHVTARAPGRLTQGDGLRIDLDNNRMVLLDNVQSRYAP